MNFKLTKQSREREMLFGRNVQSKSARLISASSAAEISALRSMPDTSAPIVGLSGLIFKTEDEAASAGCI
jgi:hypothetical protein